MRENVPKTNVCHPPLRPRHRERKRGGLAALPRCAPPTATPTRSNYHFPFHQVHSTVILFLKEICCFWNPFAHTNMNKLPISHHVMLFSSSQTNSRLREFPYDHILIKSPIKKTYSHGQRHAGSQTGGSESWINASLPHWGATGCRILLC